jgi:hypothetical protein
MTLGALVDELQHAAGPVTGLELAARLGISKAQVTAMLDALRASGRLRIDESARDPMPTCSSGGSCLSSCPGPENCPLTVDLNVTGLHLRLPTSR